MQDFSSQRHCGAGSIIGRQHKYCAKDAFEKLNLLANKPVKPFVSQFLKRG